MGYFHGIDPAACLVRDGKVEAFVEEERVVRFKHAPSMFPIRSIQFCLERSGLDLTEIDAFVYGWDSPRYSNGEMAEFYAQVNDQYSPDEATRAWQRGTLSWFNSDALKARLESELVRQFGVPRKALPELLFFPHHETHASAAFFLSPFDEALVLTLDGSGDSDCTTVWHGRGTELEPLAKIQIPHSLGWFYAAVTEFLGFKAYDGEYKVMGLAAYGRENRDLRDRLARVVHEGPRGFDYVVEPRYIHHGPHSHSTRFTDHLVELLRVEPRLWSAPLKRIHEDLAFEAQRALEEHTLRLVAHFQRATGLENLCIGGGVGLNVKLNSRLQRSGHFASVFPFPIPGDSGLGIGAGVALHVREAGCRPEPLGGLYWGPSFSDEEVETQVRSCGLSYRRCDDIADATAELLAAGKIVGWFQGAMEAGPRALGGRSILADPRDVTSRDRVNSAIKFREYWRPFCPSLSEDSAAEYLSEGRRAPYMIVAFEATERAREKAPAIVHVDGTVRPQTVDRDSNPRYHRLLERFAARTGVPIVLNTSFNIKGEAIVCTPRDALRTFWSTGLDALAIGSCLIEKPEDPAAEPLEDDRS
ncbi:MAG: nodulation protein [bacterium]|nr:nodulation protein [bacterium]